MLRVGQADVHGGERPQPGSGGSVEVGEWLQRQVGAMPSRASRVKDFVLSDGNTSSSAKMPLVAGWSRGQRARVAGEGPGGEPASPAGWIDGGASTSLRLPLHRWAPALLLGAAASG